MPENMRYDNNGQPMGYGDSMDPSMYGQQDPAWPQYQQPNAYQGGMPSPQEIYAQQQFADPNQMYMDQQGMYGAQPMQADPYGQYPAQGGYLEQDPMAMQQPYMDQDPQFGQVPGYGQMPQQQAYPGMQQPQQPFGQQVPNAQQPQMQPQQAMPQQMPPAADQQAQRAPQPQPQAQPKNLGPEPPASKAMLCMILGILSVVFALIPPVGIVLAIVVRKMSSAYIEQGGTSPKAETGRIFATVGFIFGVIMLVVLLLMALFIYAGLYGEGQARSWAVFFNNSPFGSIWRIPIPNPLG